MVHPTVKEGVFYLKILGLSIFFIGTTSNLYAEEDVEFNTDVLDLGDRDNVDLSQFSRAGYIMPGQYGMKILVNKISLPEAEIEFLTSKDDPKKTFACLERPLVFRLGLKPEILHTLTWIHDDLCLDFDSLEGMQVRGDLSKATLSLNVPQAYLEYSTEYWDPPSRWDEGISGVLFDYNLNYQLQKQLYDQKNSNQLVSGLGTLGFNLNAWRFRADWQGQYDHQSDRRSDYQSDHQSERRSDQSNQNFEWNRVYVYKAIPQLKAKLTLGEDYLESGIFDGFRFIGASLKSDDTMLPPNLRGYAPEVRGVANSNALVSVSQQGRVLYETQVAAGPFRIQDLSDAVAGELNVTVKEQDGQVREFTINTASIPYLTRPGLVRYKLTAGQPKDSDSGAYEKDFNFGVGEFSWGVSNGWSLYGGMLASGDYQSAALGVGRDLLAFGAISADMNQSFSHFSDQPNKSGTSYRVSYSKRFDQYDSQIAFAGYRFSQEDYMTPSEYLSARRQGSLTDKNKEMYSISFNKHFRDKNLSFYANYSRQTYWDRQPNNRYDLSLSRYFSLGRFNNLTFSINAFRHSNNGVDDDGATLSISMPWKNATLSYNSNFIKDSQSHTVGYFNRGLNNKNIYNVMLGAEDSDLNLSGYYSREGDVAKFNGSATYRENSSIAMGMSLQGGMTLTPEGGALHRVNALGGTRVLIDTQGVQNVPVRGYGIASPTNVFGKSVIADINSYYRNQVSIDLTKLGDHAEAVNSMTRATLTEGAIGYRQFDVISGAKAMAVITLANEKSPPFGAIVLNQKNQSVGLIGDQGNVYLSGVKAGERMSLQWAGQVQCQLQIPAQLAEDLLSNVLVLPCQLQ